MSDSSYLRYTTAGGISVTRHSRVCDGEIELRRRMLLLDTQPGLLLSCGVEYPGRYRKRNLLLVNPPIRLCARQQQLTVTALNARGRVLLPAFAHALQAVVHTSVQFSADCLQVSADKPDVDAPLPEEMRTRRPGVFDLLRAGMQLFSSAEDNTLGLYGAFAYDLAFQLEAITIRLPRAAGQRELVLYMPDEVLLHDPLTGSAMLHSYDFVCADDNGRLQTTGGLKRLTAGGSATVLRPGAEVLDAAEPSYADWNSDHAPGEYAAVVEKVRQYCAGGELFEAVPGQTFSMRNLALPSTLYQRLREQNPAPYGALINLGEQEFLICASPEMFVRVKQGRVESCPISGTIARGGDALEDAQQIQTLLNSAKDEAELSMCTDVDRNDKSRVCEAGSVRIIGRRQVELYSRLVHTVDHVEGQLQSPFDALDAFLTHTWAVTVTGAPKLRAMQFIEDHEKSARAWYGGAFGCLGFDGSMDTGLTLRSIQLVGDMAHVRVGATVLMDSDPQAEEAETRLKASVLLDVLRAANQPQAAPGVAASTRSAGGSRLRALMVDHQDSFVMTLAAAFRQHGVDVSTLRAPAARARLVQNAAQGQLPDLVILSPGPGRPQDFDCAATLELCEQLGIPVFGVCLGLQAMVEYAGGRVSRLGQAVHGKASVITHKGSRLFAGLPATFSAGRYHSLHAHQLPHCLNVTAHTELPEPCVMAVEHRQLPWMAVQFHPESLLSMHARTGERLIRNVTEWVREHQAQVIERAAMRRAGMALSNIKAAMNT